MSDSQPSILLPGSRVEVVVQISEYDLETFIKEHYKVSQYSFHCDMETGNDSTVQFRVEPSPTALEDYQVNEIKQFVEDDGNSSMITGTLLEDLCNKGLISPCTLVVSVCW